MPDASLSPIFLPILDYLRIMHLDLIESTKGNLLDRKGVVLLVGIAPDSGLGKFGKSSTIATSL